jgi:hypothetical protein
LIDLLARAPGDLSFMRDPGVVCIQQACATSVAAIHQHTPTLPLSDTALSSLKTQCKNSKLQPEKSTEKRVITIARAVVQSKSQHAK